LGYSTAMRILSSSLAREIAVLLSVKAVALFVLWVLFFGPWRQPTIAPTDIQTRLLGDAAPPARLPPRSAYD
jgi:hypothetical protein